MTSPCEESNTFADQLNNLCSVDSNSEYLDSSYFNFDISLSLHTGSPIGGMFSEREIVDPMEGSIVQEDTNIFPQQNGLFSGYSHVSVSDFSLFWSL